MKIENENLVNVLYEMARMEPKEPVRKLLHDHADCLNAWVKEFVRVPSYENLTSLNGAWARTHAILRMVTPKVPPDDGIGGRIAACVIILT